MPPTADADSMKLQLAKMNGAIATGVVTNNYRGEDFGFPVLVVDGLHRGLVSRALARLAGYEVVEATQEERQALREARYDLRGL